MKNINFLLIGLLFVGTVFVSSCSKETKIEKNLYKKDGEWNIESLAAKQTSTYAPDVFDETFNNCGTFTFKKDGSGNFILTIDGDSETNTFSHSNTEDKLTLIINGETRVFDILEWEKDEMKIAITENFYEGVDGNVGTGTYKETYSLKKK